MREGLRRTGLTLRVQLGSNAERWRWGRLHPLHFEPFGWPARAWPGVAEEPSWPYGGDGVTVAVGEYDAASPFACAWCRPTGCSSISRRPERRALGAGAGRAPSTPAIRCACEGVERWLAGRPGVLATHRFLVEDGARARLVLVPAAGGADCCSCTPRCPASTPRWSERCDPELAGRPVIVGGDPRKRGLVQAATRDALAAGVVLGMPVEEALARCPRARALRTDMARYREMDKRVRACFGRVCERLEPAGLAAAYLDVRESRDATAEEIARGACARSVASELHLPLRVGAAPTKVVARHRLRGAPRRRASCRRRRRPRSRRFLAPLPVACLPGVGPNTEARLAELGAPTVGELIALGRAALERDLGNHGLAILASALGQGDDRVRAARHPQTLSQEATLAAGEIDRVALAEQLRVSGRTARAGARARAPR